MQRILLLSLTCATQAFYLPGVLPRNYAEAEPVDLKVPITQAQQQIICAHCTRTAVFFFFSKTQMVDFGRILHG